MKFIIVFGLTSVLLSTPVMANENQVLVDVYGSRQVTTETITKNPSMMNRLEAIRKIARTPDSVTSSENKKKMQELMESVLEDVVKMGDFSFLTMAYLFYPNNPRAYYTIDIVDKGDKRLEVFQKNPDKTIPDPDHLIQSWQEYEKTGSDIFYKEKVGVAYKNCPVWHCVYGFDDEKLKKYQSIFDNNVDRNQAKLVQVLRDDKNPEKRAAAVYLLAHIKDGNRLVRILTPSMTDSNLLVRNNVMRVLAESLSRIKNPDFPIQKAVDALDYPTISDRNKSLYILDSLSKHSRYAKYLVRHAGPQLIGQLKMSQLNVHDLAYGILKRISGKNYGERDYQSWEAWLTSNQ
jgi:hypothetical protein